MYELDGGRVMVGIHRNEVLAIELRYGVRAPHPIMQVIMGALLVGIGYFPLQHFLDWARRGGDFVKAQVLVVPFAVVGLWLLVGAFRRGYFLDIELKKGRKRLIFKGTSSREQLEAYVSAIERKWGQR